MNKDNFQADAIRVYDDLAGLLRKDLLRKIDEVGRVSLSAPKCQIREWRLRLV